MLQTLRVHIQGFSPDALETARLLTRHPIMSEYREASAWLRDLAQSLEAFDFDAAAEISHKLDRTLPSGP